MSHSHSVAEAGLELMQFGFRVWALKDHRPLSLRSALQGCGGGMNGVTDLQITFDNKSLWCLCKQPLEWSLSHEFHPAALSTLSGTQHTQCAVLWWRSKLRMYEKTKSWWELPAPLSFESLLLVSGRCKKSTLCPLFIFVKRITSTYLLAVQIYVVMLLYQFLGK